MRHRPHCLRIGRQARRPIASRMRCRSSSPTGSSAASTTRRCEFLSSRAYACLNLNEEARGRALDAAVPAASCAASWSIRLASWAPTRISRASSIAFTPRDPKRVVIEHAFRREFLLTPLTEAQARPYLCDGVSAAPTGGEYFGAVFQFRVTGGATFGLLWTREARRSGSSCRTSRSTHEWSASEGRNCEIPTTCREPVACRSDRERGCLGADGYQVKNRPPRQLPSRSDRKIHSGGTRRGEPSSVS